MQYGIFLLANSRMNGLGCEVELELLNLGGGGEPFRDGKMDDVMLSKQLFLIWYGLCETISGISCCS